jgi:hypothetical protein
VGEASGGADRDGVGGRAARAVQVARSVAPLPDGVVDVVDRPDRGAFDARGAEEQRFVDDLGRLDEPDLARAPVLRAGG